MQTIQPTTQAERRSMKHVLTFAFSDAVQMILHCAAPSSYTAFNPHEVCYAIGRAMYRQALRDGWSA